MKMSSVFNVITDGKDVLAYFEGVEDKDQLVSRLERLKRADAEEILACIDGLRMSISELLNDTLEMNASSPFSEDDDDDDSGLDLEGLEDESESTPEDPPKETSQE